MDWNKILFLMEYGLSDDYDMKTFNGRLGQDDACRLLGTPTDHDRQLYRQTSRSKTAHHERRKHLTNPPHRFSQVFFGNDYILRPWYTAPYPAEYYRPDGHLWLCPCCLRYFGQPTKACRHFAKCAAVPPGREVYRDTQQAAGFSLFEVDGAGTGKPFCQSLCLLAKMFLDHKTLYYDTDTFSFYVLTEWHRHGAGVVGQLVGYFSKEKQSPSDYNLSCILVMPQHQRKGYGTFLIDFSYLLVRSEGRCGSPEKPLSDLGFVSYIRYWVLQVQVHRDLLAQAADVQEDVDGVKRVCLATGMTRNDVMAALEWLGAVWRVPQTGLVVIKPECIPGAAGSRVRLATPEKYCRHSDAGPQ